MRITTIVYIIALCLCTVPGFAGERDREQIGKSGMLTIWEAGGIVEGFEINGGDLADIVRETDVAVRVNRSVITGGLDFTAIGVVANEIHITDSDIFVTQKNPAESTGHSVIARHTVFEKSVDFDSTRFHGGTDFEAAVFLGAAYFESSEFLGGALFNMARFEAEGLFNSAMFGGNAGFGAARFQGEAEFYWAEFGGITDFGSAQFDCNAVFGATRFAKTGAGVGFISVVFGKDADFESARFESQADFRSSRFGGKALLKRSVFDEGGTFNSSRFEGMAHFQSAEFGGNADFRLTRFQNSADFNSALFAGGANFLMARFAKTTYFKGAAFGELIFGFTKFGEYADIRNIEARKFVFEFDTPSIVKSRMDFRNAKITDGRFVDVIFEKDVDFSDADFGANYEEFRNFTGPPRPPGTFEGEKMTIAVFRYVTFEKNAYFVRTKLARNTFFEMVNFKQNANFNKADFEREHGIATHFSFSYVTFKELVLRWRQLPDVAHWVRRPDAEIRMLGNRLRMLKFLPEGNPGELGRIREELEKAKAEADKIEPLSEALRNLESNFRKRKLLDDANLAHFHLKEAELGEARIDPETGTWLRIQKELEYVLWGMSCGYGTKIWRVIGWSVFCHLLFTIVYYTCGNLFLLPEDEKLELKGKGIFNFPHFYIADETGEKTYRKTETFKMAHRFSMVVLFKFGIKNIVISGKIWRIPCKYFVWTAWILGFYLLFCLGITLSNTFPLINKLVEGMM